MDETNKCEEVEGNEEEEASLCDFSLTLSDNGGDDDGNHRPPSSDFFEFFTHRHVSPQTTSHAEDIISGGVLVPYNYRRPVLINSFSRHDDTVNLSTRYCESLPELKSSSSVSSDRGIMRSSRSLDCERRRRNSTKLEATNVRRSFSKDEDRSEGFRGLKPRWYGLVFRNNKFPPEMDLRDMRNRQFRRSVPPTEVRLPVNRRSSWSDDLLKLLSCRGDASVTVKAPNLKDEVREVHGAQHLDALWTPYC